MAARQHHRQSCDTQSWSYSECLIRRRVRWPKVKIFTAWKSNKLPCSFEDLRYWWLLMVWMVVQVGLILWRVLFGSIELIRNENGQSNISRIKFLIELVNFIRHQSHETGSRCYCMSYEDLGISGRLHDCQQQKTTLLAKHGCWVIFNSRPFEFLNHIDRISGWELGVDIQTSAIRKQCF